MPESRLRSFPVVARMRRDPLGLFLHMKEEQGDVAYVPYGSERLFLISDPELVREVLVSEAERYGREVLAYKSWRRSPRFPREQGLFHPNSNPAVHLRARRALQPAFKKARADISWPDLVAIAEEGCGGWAGEVEVMTELRRMALLMSLEVLIRERPNIPMDELIPAVEDMIEVTVAASSASREALVFLRLRQLIRRARHQQQILDLLAEHIRASRSFPGETLFHLLDATAKEEGLDERALLLEAYGHLFSLPDSNVNVNAWTFYLLAQNPQALKRVRTEAAVALRSSSSPSADQIAYTRAVLSEALRLYPPSWRLGRRALVDHHLGGVDVARGDHVWISPYVIQRDSRWWPEPEEFLPERWLEPDKMRPRLAFVPFGAGPRKCLGEDIAWAEMVATTFVVLDRFDITPLGKIEAEPAAALRPRGGKMKIRVMPR